MTDPQVLDSLIKEGKAVLDEMQREAREAGLIPPSPEEARAVQIASVIDGLSASAADQFKAARAKIDQFEQTVLTSAAKAKTILDDHVRLVLEAKEEIARMSSVMEKLSADHARLVNAETV